MTADQRSIVLARIRSALGTRTPVPAVPRDYRQHGDHPAGHPALLDMFTERLLDYRATVHRCSRDVAATTLRAVTTGTGPVIVPSDFPPALSPVGSTVDHAAVDALRLDEFRTVLTMCAAAAAETGTIALDGGAGQERRILTLLPDRHICVVQAEQVAHTVPELLARLDPSRPLTLISGPSATSDIELQRVEGVHGPRSLVVILVG